MSPWLRAAAIRRTLMVLVSASAGCWLVRGSTLQNLAERPPVASVQVLPASATLPVGQTLQAFAIVRDAFGNTLNGRTVTWSSTLATTVSGTGLVTGVAPGLATIIATSEGRTGTAFITVAAVPVALVTVTPATATVLVGQTVQLTATLRDANGNVLSGRPVAWATNNVAATVINGLVTGVAVGSATITATSEGRSGTAFITVASVPVASVTVSPTPVVVQAGQTVQLTATPQDAGGNALGGKVVTWSSSNVATATVTASGLVMCMSVGTATITATSEGASGAAAVSCVGVADHILVTYSALAPAQTWVLLDGQSSVLCRNDLSSTGITGNPADFVVDNTRPDPTCNAEVAVFASEHAAVLDLNPPFTAGADIVPENPGPAVALEINLWVVAYASAAEANAHTADVESLLQAVFLETQALLVENHVGVELRLPLADGTWVPVTSWTLPASRLIPTSDPRAGTIGDRCTQSGINTLHATPSLYSSGQLNLYVVDLVQGSTAIYEYSCLSEANPPVLTGGENVIYFSRLHHMNASLAHVFGHAFSLIDKGFPNLADGHTGAKGLFELPGFAQDNIMWTGLDPNVDSPQRTFSLGQVYRMTLDGRSWLNKSGPHTKSCPDSPLGDIACPPLVFGW